MIKMLPADRPTRRVDNGSSRLCSYRGARPTGRRYTSFWVRTSVGRRCRRLAWRVLSLVDVLRTALCAPGCWLQDKGGLSNPRAGLGEVVIVDVVPNSK